MYRNYLSAAWRVSRTCAPVSASQLFNMCRVTHLKLYLSLSDVLLTSAAACDFLCLGDLIPHSLRKVSLCIPLILIKYSLLR